jgi:uncharacterized protein YgbK (DUF1537 family)
MDTHLPPVFSALDALGAPVLHYKGCSTFDSSPGIGSIGRALDIGLAHTARGWCAMVVGAPALRRYQAFGTLFAAVDGVAHRLDRHPTMSRHPVTPMAESDLRRHLAPQTAEPVALVDLVALKGGGGEAALAAARAGGARAVLFDVIDDETLAEAGRLIWRGRGGGLLAVASSGLEYALVAHWRAAGLLPPASPPSGAGAVDRLLVVSGSCSPVTAGQIGWAVANGFVPVRLDVPAAIDPSRAAAEIARAADAAMAALTDGRDAIVMSAEGPGDPAIAALRDAAARAGQPAEAARRAVAAALGAVLAAVVPRAGLPRGRRRRRHRRQGHRATRHSRAGGDRAAGPRRAAVPRPPAGAAVHRHRAEGRTDRRGGFPGRGQAGRPALAARRVDGARRMRHDAPCARPAGFCSRC